MHTMEARVTDILATQFKVKQDTTDPELTFKDLSFDSLVLIELSLVLEKEFGVEIAEGELTDEHTVSDLVGILAGKGAVV